MIANNRRKPYGHQRRLTERREQPNKNASPVFFPGKSGGGRRLSFLRQADELSHFDRALWHLHRAGVYSLLVFPRYWIRFSCRRCCRKQKPDDSVCRF